MTRTVAGAVLVVVLLGGLAHGGTVDGGWVYDDHRFAVQNPALERWDVVAFFTDPATASASEGIAHDIYRPLRTLSYAVDRRVFGLDPTGWHVVNVLLHLLAAVLVFRLLRPLVGETWLPATAGAALFAVHPAAVECVAWISSRGDLLAVVLMLCALLVLERRGGVRTALGAGCMALACLAKESALVLPALLLLRDLALPGSRALPRRLTALRVALLGVVAGGYLALRLSVLPGLAQVEGFVGGSWETAARAMLAGLAWYAGAVVWPSGFPFDLHLPIPLAWSDANVVLGLGLLLTLVAAGAWGLARRNALLAFATWGALACLVPVSNVIVPLKAVVAERFLYPVLVCVAAGVAWGLWRLRGPWRVVGGVAVALAVFALLFVSRERGRAWESDRTLWETVIRKRPSHMRAYEGLGFEYLRQGRIRDAEIAYRSYLEYSPTDGKAMRLLGDALGEVAASLRVSRPQPGVVIEDLARRRQEARIAQLRWYGRALRVWDSVGLVVGRGSPRMLRETYERIREAAWDLGDLRKAKQANDALLRFEGIDPDDAEAVRAHASHLRRRVRMDLALKAVTTEVPSGLSADLLARRAAERALVLQDVGLAPERSDRVVLGELLPRYRRLAEEPEADLGVQRNVLSILERLGRHAEARTLREALRREHPRLAFPEGGR